MTVSPCNRRLIVLLMALGSLVSWTVVAPEAAVRDGGNGHQADGRRERDQPRDRTIIHGPFGFGLGQLDLTEAQRTQIRALAEQYSQEFREVAQRMRASRRAVREAIAHDPANESLLRQRRAETSNLEAEGAVLRAKFQAELRAVLTAEQRRQLDELRAEREHRLEERRRRFEERREQRRRLQRDPPGRHSFFTPPTHG